MRWRMFRRYCGALSEGSALCRKNARVNISVRERARFFEKSAVPIGPRLPCIHGTTPRANVPNAQIGVWFHGLMLPAAADIIADMSLKTPHFSTTKSATLATAALVGAFRMADPSAKFSRRRPYTRMRARASTVARLPEWLVRSQPRDYHDRRCRFAETVVEGTIRGAAGHSCADRAGHWLARALASHDHHSYQYCLRRVRCRHRRRGCHGRMAGVKDTNRGLIAIAAIDCGTRKLGTMFFVGRA